MVVVVERAHNTFNELVSSYTPLINKFSALLYHQYHTVIDFKDAKQEVLLLFYRCCIYYKPEKSVKFVTFFTSSFYRLKSRFYYSYFHQLNLKRLIVEGESLYPSSKATSLYPLSFLYLISLVIDKLFKRKKIINMFLNNEIIKTDKDKIINEKKEKINEYITFKVKSFEKLNILEFSNKFNITKAQARAFINILKEELKKIRKQINIVQGKDKKKEELLLSENII